MNFSLYIYTYTFIICLLKLYISSNSPHTWPMKGPCNHSSLITNIKLVRSSRPDRGWNGLILFSHVDKSYHASFPSIKGRRMRLGFFHIAAACSVSRILCSFSSSPLFSSLTEVKGTGFSTTRPPWRSSVLVLALERRSLL